MACITCLSHAYQHLVHVMKAGNQNGGGMLLCIEAEDDQANCLCLVEVEDSGIERDVHLKTF